MKFKIRAIINILLGRGVIYKMKFVDGITLVKGQDDACILQNYFFEDGVREVPYLLTNPSWVSLIDPDPYTIKAEDVRKRIKELGQYAGKAGQTESVG